jgi:hypothetical protein
VSVIDWMLEGDPAIRWQVLRDLANAGGDVAAERARVEHDGWGASPRARGSRQLWDGGACFPASHTGGDKQPWTATMHITDLQLLGLDPASQSARRAIGLVAENGAGARRAAVFRRRGRALHQRQDDRNRRVLWVDVTAIVERILSAAADGGWNCEAENGSVRSSFDTTLNVLDGLLEVERATGGPEQVRTARLSGEYLLQRGLFRRKSTAVVVQ